ncbi:putative uncharacterized protein [Prevotella sp. CAG:617]|nr:putative uncharacterized protein [Prevotella sp. CAG:617]
MALCGLIMPSFFIPSQARKKAKKSTVTAVTSNVKDGLFTVEKNGNDWFFIIPDSLLERRFLTTTRYTATPANCGKFAGEQINGQTIYFEKAPDERLLMRAELLINVSDSLDDINRAIIISNENPIIGSFKLEKYKKGFSKINVTRFFNDDNPAISFSQYDKQNFGLTSLISDKCYINEIKTFPMNTEVKVTKTWSSSRSRIPAGAVTGSVTFGFNVSFVLLPKVPMMKRYFDPRVGYFADSYTSFTDDQQRVKDKNFIVRWRLEPKPEDIEKMKAGELVEPKKPIIYYIDPATPKKWRKYLIAGVNDWQKAFEKAGFKNAIMAKEWPENDSTMSMEDARYSVIRYLASPIENAYGPQVHDPRSGEILESHICWYHNVMRLVHDWYMIQASSVDPEARCMKFNDELMGELIRFVSSHEVGHTLGLRHNFGSSSTVPVDSLRSKKWVEAFGHTPSIMDYARFNYVAQPEDSISRVGIFPRIGDYDMWAIQWGYSPMWNAYDEESDHYELEKLITKERVAENPRLWFGDGETSNVSDPRCQTEDLGDDAVKASYYGILNLKRLVKNLEDWTYESNDIYSSNISSMYSEIRNQYLRYLGHVIRNIGGKFKNYKTIDESGDVYTDVPKSRQVRALDFIDKNVFNEPVWLIDVPYINRIYPNKKDVTELIGVYTVRNLLSRGYNDMNDSYPYSEFLQDMTDRLFKKVFAGGQLSEYDQLLESTYVTTLCRYFSSSSPEGSNRKYTMSALRELRAKLSKVTAGNESKKAHIASLIDVIDRALVIK